MQLEIVRLAFDAVRRNALRSMLNILGVVIGIAAVTALAAVGEGTRRKVEAGLGGLGVDVLTLRGGQSARGGSGVRLDAKPFDYRDVEALRTHVHGLRLAVPLASSTQRTVARRSNWSATIVGTETGYFEARAWKSERGRYFSALEMSAGKPVCLIGETVRRNLLPEGDAIGQLVRVSNTPCTVIGVLASRGQTSGSIDDDNIVAMPIDTYLRRIQGTQDIPAIVLSASSTSAIDRVKQRVERLMRERRGLASNQPEDFTVLDSRHAADTMRATGGAMQLMLGAVAAIGLLMGGIGIMNMMLVSVTERTREIGILISIGALPWQVLLQFIAEAILLAAAGGMIGAVAGVAVAAICAFALGIAFVVHASMLALALSVSILVGAVSGLAPAARAARLKPVDALRAS